ncbi:hypothetical protein RCL_jg15181.t1 [Rhizophagus clarus]|uniref:Uncharacterized protein n=1 Tax=Rhizophagus clarus TaxID=94130 RepID=A0A8H3L340_9GLOM|nr:hypothetical protein RCL_jg15181.t1 [Rhizophagus clarus]
MRHVSHHHWESFMDMMIKLKVRKAVAVCINLVRSQLKFALRDKATKLLYEFEKDMLEVEYEVIRDRQLKVLELGDDLFISKPPVK